MSSSSSRFTAMTAPQPHPPVCVRSRSLHPSDVQPVSQVVMQRPPQKPVWTQESIPPPYASPSFPLDPSLYGHTVSVLSRGSPHGVQLISSPMAPTPVSRLALLPQQYHSHPGNAMHLLSHPSMDARMLQRSQSDYGPAFASHPTDPRVLYNYRVHADQRGPPMGWNPTEIVLHPSSAPRQRSAKACKKCRRRKTKCSGGQPCTRCNARGLDCEYDEKSAPKGPSKARMELRKKPSKSGSFVSRTSSSEDGADENPPAGALNYLDNPSPALEVPGHQASADVQPLQGYNVVVPSANAPLSFEDADPAFYAPYVGEQLDPASFTDNAPSVDASDSLIQGYTVTEDEETVLISPVLPNGAWQIPQHGYDLDDSDSSRPSSSHSTSSTTSSWSMTSSEASFASSASSAQTIWSTNFPGFAAGRHIPPALSASSSESSLKDALLDRPRLRTSSSTSSIAHMAAADASLLTDVLSHASISESGCVAGAPSETSLAAPQDPALPPGTSAFVGTHPSSVEFSFDDVFTSLAADQHPSTSSFTIAHAGVTDLDDTGAGDITIKGRTSRGLAHYTTLGADALSASYSPSNFDFETPRVSDAYQFGGPMSLPSPGLHGHGHGASTMYH